MLLQNNNQIQFSNNVDNYFNFSQSKIIKSILEKENLKTQNNINDILYLPNLNYTLISKPGVSIIYNDTKAKFLVPFLNTI